MDRRRVTLLVSLLMSLVSLAQEPIYDTRRFDEDSGLSHSHSTQILQDPKGMIWISTWNGLNRYDGYEFRKIVARPGDGCTMSSDRIRDIWLNDDGQGIICQVEDSLYLFDLRTYQFHDITSSEGLKRSFALKKKATGRGLFNGTCIEFTDQQGQNWQLHANEVLCRRLIHQPCVSLPQAQQAIVRCLARDAKGRIWVMTKEDATIRIYDEHLHLTGYLTSIGSLSSTYTSWGVPVYCFTQARNGTIWLGSKPGGLFRLKERHGGYSIEPITELTNNHVYDVKEDRWGRLWIATMDDGLCCLENPDDEKPHVTNRFSSYPKKLAKRVRYIHLTRDSILLAATTEGLVVGKIGQSAENSRFILHRKESFRQSSLLCNTTMDIQEDSHHKLYVSTETEGICQILSKNLLADTLSFKPCKINGGWASDIVISQAIHKDRILVTSNHLLTVYHPDQETGRLLDVSFFGLPYRFSEARPLLLDHDRWLLGTNDAAVILDMKETRRTPYVPALVLTGISIKNGVDDLAVDDLDTLVLTPAERSLSIQFAALDYTHPERIRYAFRMGKDQSWNTIGHGHTVTLLDLPPDTYELYIRSTNADGIWVDNLRKLTIIVKPTFWETPWAILLYILTILGIGGAIVYTLLYIKRINRRHRETLDAYLALLDEKTESPRQTGEQLPPKGPSPSEISRINPEDDAFLKRVISFVEEHISDSDINIGDMADAGAVSRSGLQRKMKHLMGITPNVFLREVRIKKACQLLSETDMPIVDVAYRCGFSDPKYFSKCFKISVGKSPSDYKNG